MKILFITNFPSCYRVKFFNEMGKACDLSVAYERVRALHRDEKWQGGKNENFKEIFLKLRPKGTSQSSGSAIVKLIKNQKYDGIIFGGYSSPSVMRAIAYCRRHGVRYYIEFDGCFNKKDAIAKRLVKKYLLKKAVGCFVTCKETRQYLRGMGMPDEKIFGYPFTSVYQRDILPAPPTPVEKEEIRRQFGLPGGILLISVGQFIHRKGFDVLLRALSRVERDISVLIVGGEPTEEYLSLCEQEKLTNVRFMSFLAQEELFRLYRCADVFVLPTREDVWGLVINEAMACGMPVISTDRCIAAEELIVPGRSGMIVPAGNVEAMAEAINAVLTRDCAEMGRESLDAMRKYTIEKMAQRHIDVLCAECGK